jgi:hypothetical protein
LLRARHAQLMISFLAIERLLTDIHTAHDRFESEVEHVFQVLMHELVVRKQEILESATSSSGATSTLALPLPLPPNPIILIA